MTDISAPILVAVGSEDCDSALRFSVTEALRTGRELRLVHALHMPPSGPESFVLAFQAGLEIGQRALGHAQARVAELGSGRVPVSIELVREGHGTVHDLVERSSSAHQVVLQHRRRGVLGRWGVGSTTYAVAARAHAPVVSVPQDWTAPEQPFGVVTVGVHDPDRSAEILRAAFELAADSGARLRVLRTWWLANGYDDVVVDDAMRSEFAAHATTLLEDAVAPLRAERPAVEVDLDVAHVPTVLGLLAASRTSDMLVIGRRHRGLPVGSHLGPTARATIHESACPVVVVEPAPLDAPTPAAGLHVVH